jgi:hypothetical protein
MSKSKVKPPGERGTKSYRSPKVKTYGNIREITKAVGRTGNRDNAGSRPTKTALP